MKLAFALPIIALIGLSACKTNTTVTKRNLYSPTPGTGPWTARYQESLDERDPESKKEGKEGSWKHGEERQKEYPWQ